MRPGFIVASCGSGLVSRPLKRLSLRACFPPFRLGANHQLLEDKEKRLRSLLQQQRGEIAGVEQELAILQRDLRQTSGPKKQARPSLPRRSTPRCIAPPPFPVSDSAFRFSSSSLSLLFSLAPQAIEYLRARIEESSNRVAEARHRAEAAKRELASARASLDAEEKSRERLCEDLRGLVQANLVDQHSRLNELTARLERLYGQAGGDQGQAAGLADARGSTPVGVPPPPFPVPGSPPSAPAAPARGSEPGPASPLGRRRHPRHGRSRARRAPRAFAGQARGRGGRGGAEGRAGGGQGEAREAAASGGAAGARWGGRGRGRGRAGAGEVGVAGARAARRGGDEAVPAGSDCGLGSTVRGRSTSRELTRPFSFLFIDAPPQPVSSMQLGAAAAARRVGGGYMAPPLIDLRDEGGFSGFDV